jgi:uncharacterized protein
LNNSSNIKSCELRLPPGKADNELFIIKQLEAKLRLGPGKVAGYKIIKRSIDARKKQVQIVLRLEAYIDQKPEPQILKPLSFPKVSDRTAIIIGFGPAGMFAALRLLELGIRPIIFERGKKVSDRRRDLAAIFKERTINEDSNYCFGEGGAGTYSDGKLYTRSKKRGDIRKILEILVSHGAADSILYDAHPHIGTNKLPRIVQEIRETIIKHGGEIHFEHRVTGLLIEDNKILGVVANDKEFKSKQILLATGHSARDVFHMLDRHNVRIEAKEFALGVRIEHPQSLIDSIQYKCETRGPHLPAASYSLVRQINGQGVFSFCMCPGGIIAPSMTASNEVVVNGWSPSNRDGKFANSGFVVQVKEADWQKYLKPDENVAFAAMNFQAHIEKLAFEKGGKDLTAPAQTIQAFVQKRTGSKLPECSYIPGIKEANMTEVLPYKFSNNIREALKYFGKRMKGFVSHDSVLVGVESRTSSPIRVPRDRETREHPEVKGLFPCGEGAGYAGGIMSAALDGIACAEQMNLLHKGNK